MTAYTDLDIPRVWYGPWEATLVARHIKLVQLLMYSMKTPQGAPARRINIQVKRFHGGEEGGTASSLRSKARNGGIEEANDS